MSGGLAVKTKKRGFGAGRRPRSEPTTRPAFFARVRLDGSGAASPLSTKEVQPEAVTPTRARDRSPQGRYPVSGPGAREPGPAPPDAHPQAD
jgi:hypothetical protein